MLADVQVLIADAGPISRQFLAWTVDTMPGFQVAACCGSIVEALGALKHGTADLVLLRWSQKKDALTFIPLARRSGFSGPIVVLASRLKIPLGAKLVQQGASAICPANTPFEQLLEIMQLAVKGVTAVPERYFRAAAQSTVQTFNDRESQVIKYLLEGLGTREIATRIQLSEATVKATFQRIYNSTGVRSRGRLACMLLEQHNSRRGLGQSSTPVPCLERLSPPGRLAGVRF